MSILNRLKTIDWRAFDAGIEIPGLTEAELPNLEAMTETVSGAGIAGEADMPTLGHYGSMTLKLKFRQVSEALLALSVPEAHPIELRGSTQVYNSLLGISQTEAVKIVTRSIPKSNNLGTLAPGKPTESEVEFEVVYIKVFVAGKPLFEHDKFNNITIVAGLPAMAQSMIDIGVL